MVGIAALLLVFGPWTAVAQEEEGGGRDLEDILKDVVRDAVEDQGSSNLGRVARVSVVRRAASVVDLSVDVEGISDPGRVTLRVEVFDSEYRTLPGFESSHGPIPAGDGSVAVSVVYGAVEDVQSVGLKVGLVDTETQRMFSRRKAALPWEWGGGTGGGASAGLSTLSSRGSGDQPSRQPVVVSIEPSRVGDTPAMEIPTIVGVRVAQQPTPMAQGPPTGGTSAAPGVLGTATKVQPTVVDLYSAAARATWTSDAGRLTFGGETGDTRGYVRALGDAKLNDGQVHHKVLQTHPAFKDNGRIAGAFAVTVPKGATAVSAGGGFLPNVTRSDGVKVVVKIGRTAAESTAVVSKMVRPADGIVKIAGAIPAEMQGKDVILTLEVQAGPTSTQDWFVWVEPAIR
ncbi:MAG: hypothetical protein C3F15_09820 [Holophagae bacterium]|nr:MAG: hypothetical protein C3F15_09820 [Holophagae bacterium]